MDLKCVAALKRSFTRFGRIGNYMDLKLERSMGNCMELKQDGFGC